MKSLVAIMILASTYAQADGFTCQATEHSLDIKIYNHVDPQDGTRVGAVMVLSNPSIQHGRKTIARFADANGVLENHGPLYTADVDLRFSDSSRKGELIAGTKLGELDKIKVAVVFSYASPVEDGAELEGMATLVKRNGEVIFADLVCERYLKN